MRRIFIRNLELAAMIGVHKAEKLKPQPVRISLDLTVDDGPIDDSDIAAVVDYQKIDQRIRTMIGEGHVNLVETLADRIADLCLEDQRVHSARIRVEKPRAIAGAEAAGVEIERTRS